MVPVAHAADERLGARLLGLLRARVEELRLQVTPVPNTPAFDVPGGFLFVNWEKLSGERKTL